MTITSIYGVIYWSTPSSMSNLRAMLCRQCRVITRKSFSGSRSVTLTFDPMTLKSIGVIYWSPPASMSSLRAMDAGNVELWLRQAFQVHGHCNLDLWPNDLKINRGHLLVWPSLHIKFKDHGCRQCQVITRTSFSGSRSLWPWPLTWKSIGVIYWSLPASMSSLRVKAMLSYYSDKIFEFKVDDWDLDLWNDDLKINGVRLLVIPNLQVKFEDYRSRHCWVITRKLWSTEGPTDMCKAMIPLFFEGGIISINIFQTIILTKSQYAQIRNVDFRVLKIFSFNLTLWPRFWHNSTHIQTCSRYYEDKHSDKISICWSKNYSLYIVNKIVLQFGLVT